MRSYARIGKKGFCREKLIKPRKNEDMQGYETIWKEKLKFLWYATALQFYDNAYLRRLGQHGAEYGEKPWNYYGFDY